MLPASLQARDARKLVLSHRCNLPSFCTIFRRVFSPVVVCAAKFSSRSRSFVDTSHYRNKNILWPHRARTIAKQRVNVTVISRRARHRNINIDRSTFLIFSRVYSTIRYAQRSRFVRDYILALLTLRIRQDNYI